MHNGIGCVDDLRHAEWDRLVARLGECGLGSMEIENRSLNPQSGKRLLSKRALDHLGIRARSDQTVFAWADENC